MYRIAQVSDAHLDNAKAGAMGIDTRGNFAKVLEDIRMRDVDELVLTGDLAEPSALAWFRARLGETGLPTYLVFGNHDDRALFSESVEGRRLFYAREVGGRRALFLDSGEGLVDGEELAWLRAELASREGPFLVFIHHPVLDCGTLFMDRRYPLRNRDELRRVLEAPDREIDLFCGHYHMEHEAASGRLRQFVAPSTYYQIRGDLEVLGVDPLSIGYRLIEVDGEVRSSVVRIGEVPRRPAPTMGG